MNSKSKRVNAASMDAVRPALLPSEYYLDFLRLLREYEDVVAVITYDDLPWADDFDDQAGYPQEWKRWLKNRSAGRVSILIQHDVDSVPQRSWDTIRQEEIFGIPSIVMIFNRRLNRKWFEATGELLETEYEVDDDLMRRLGSQGWAVGYHSNALDQARFDDDLAREIFAGDVRKLRERFQIKFFSAHGGLRSPEGRTNNQLRPPDLKSLGLRWVHNGASPKFQGNWSDGGIRSERVDPETRDLRRFLLRMEKGRRYRVLTHPQYYDTTFGGKGTPLEKTAWYREIEPLYLRERGYEAWDKVRRHFDALRKRK